jgi:DNA-binding NtrC family response regulator
MPLELQPKLLRVLQEREVTPVGAATPVHVDVQVIAATNRDLEEEVEAGRFRKDLSYRLRMVELNVPLNVPPLRKRLEDIPELVDFFAHRFAQKYNRPVWRPTPEEMSAIYEFHWPGNVRQLSHMIEQSYVLNLPPRIPSTKRLLEPSTQLPYLNLTRLRDAAIRQALDATKGHKSRAARLLGVHPNTLTRLLGQLDSDGEIDI